MRVDGHPTTLIKAGQFNDYGPTLQIRRVEPPTRRNYYVLISTIPAWEPGAGQHHATRMSRKSALRQFQH